MKIFRVTRISHDTCNNTWTDSKYPSLYVEAVDANSIRQRLEKQLAFTTFEVTEIELTSLDQIDSILFNPDYWKTFDGWKALGFGPVKGSKSKRRNTEGKALFSRDQVTRRYQSNYHCNDDYNLEDDYYPEEF